MKTENIPDFVVDYNDDDNDEDDCDVDDDAEVVMIMIMRIMTIMTIVFCCLNSFRPMRRVESNREAIHVWYGL